jgi:hypothetical protein
MSDYFESDKFDEEWYCETKMGIYECRMMLNHLEYAIKMWPGAPARPAEEQEFLQTMKNRYFAMVTDYSLYKQFGGKVNDEPLDDED